MSNHSGSYLLNETLIALDQLNVFGLIGIEKTQQFFEDLKRIASYWDCNSNEILEGLSEKLNICYSCFSYDENLDNGLCSSCSHE